MSDQKKDDPEIRLKKVLSDPTERLSEEVRAFFEKNPPTEEDLRILEEFELRD